MLAEQIEAFRKQMQPRWDALRERRLLRSIQGRLQTRRSARRLRRRAISIGLPVSFAIAAVFVAYFAGAHRSKKVAVVAPVASGESATENPNAAALPAGSFDVAESRVLADGTRLDLAAAARVEVHRQTPQRVELAQSQGRVRYVVAPNPGRAFVVMADDVEVRVTGTVFVVAIDGDAGKVSVSVERGRVEVAASNGAVELRAGEQWSTSGGPGAARTERPAESPVAESPSAARVSGHTDLASPSALFDRADAQRRSGDLASAATTLREFVRRYPNDSRSALCWFTLGKVERARERAGMAAAAFRSSLELAPNGPLAEDALAEEAAAWAAAGDLPEARAAASRYLRRFSNGSHLARMQHILE